MNNYCFDIKKLLTLNTFSIALLGPSGSGKTTILKYILNECKDYFTLVFLIQGSSPSEDNIYSSYVWPNHIIFLTGTESERKIRIKTFISEIQTLGQELVKINNDLKDFNTRNVNNINSRKLIRTLFIMDDLGDDLRQFENFANVSRHNNFYFLYIIHNDTNLTKTLRKSISHFFLSVMSTPSLILEDLSKENQNNFQDVRKRFKETNNKKAFIIIEREVDELSYLQLNTEQVETCKSNFTVAKSFSKLKLLYSSYLKELLENSL